MRKRFWIRISLLSLILLEVLPFGKVNSYAANTNEIAINDYADNDKTSNTFDIKKVIPEVVVIVIAGGVLLFCISKES